MGFGEITATGRCPVCGCSVGRDAKPCKRCAVQYHQDCWTYAGGCAVYGCRPTAPRAAPAFDFRDFPQSYEEVGQQLARIGAGLTRDVAALALGALLGVAFWELMDAYGGVFFLMWFLLGLAYLLYWPFFRARGFAVTAMHAFFLGPLVHVVVPLEVPAVFALVSGLTLFAIGMMALLHARAPRTASAAMGAFVIALAALYQSDGRTVPYRVVSSGRAGSAEERLVAVPWGGERAPEITDVVRRGDTLRVIVTLPTRGPPFTGSLATTELDRRVVVSVPTEPPDIEVEYRAPGQWALGSRLALRLAGYDPDRVRPVVDLRAWAP